MNTIQYSTKRLIIWGASTLLLCTALVWASLVQAAADASVHYQSGIKYSKVQDWQEAAVEFQKAVEIDPEYKLAYANLGVALSQMGKHKAALVAFEMALNLGYDHPLFRYNRGISFARLNLPEEAALEIETSLKMDSRNVKATYDLGLIYVRLGRNEEARELVNELYRRNNKLAKELYEAIPPVYKIATVDNGGTLTGRTVLTGPVPRPRYFHLIHAPNIQFCSRMSDGRGHRILFDFTVSDSGGLKDTVIAIQGVTKGKPFDSKIQKMNIHRCHSDKYVIGVRNNENILIENMDPIRHEIATYEFRPSGVKQKSNKAVTGKSSQIRDTFVRKDTNEFVLKCNLHPFLQTRGFMVDNPYYAVTDEEGRFTIPDIPPGTYEVVAWHPFIPTQKGTITIQPGEQARVDFSFDGLDEGRHLYHDDLKGYRFQPWFDSFENFYGGPRVDDPVEVLQEYIHPDYPDITQPPTDHGA